MLLFTNNYMFHFHAVIHSLHVKDNCDLTGIIKGTFDCQHCILTLRKDTQINLCHCTGFVYFFLWRRGLTLDFTKMVMYIHSLQGSCISSFIQMTWNYVRCSKTLTLNGYIIYIRILKKGYNSATHGSGLT